MVSKLKKLPYVSGNKGRPSVDWVALHYMWVHEGKPDLKVFFVERGLNPGSLPNLSRIRKWVKGLVKIEYKAVEPKFTNEVTEDVAKEMIRQATVETYSEPAPPPEPEPEPEPSAYEEQTEPDPKPLPQPVHQTIDDRVWDKIKTWRASQSRNDYETADALRQHVKLFINQTTVRNELNGEVIGTKMRAAEMGQLGRTLLDVQRIQRLSLGMSTDNIGVKNPAEQLAAEVDRTDDDVPVFAVEVNKDGKFIRPRPRQITGAK